MLGMIFASAIRDAQEQVDAAKRGRAMIIEAGKSYRTRDGRRADIERILNDEFTICKALGGIGDTCCAWSMEGRYFPWEETSRLDLIAPWEEPETVKAKIMPETAQVPDHALREMIKDEVGAEFGAKPLQPQVGDILRWQDDVTREVYAVRGDFVWLSCPSRPQGKTYKLSSLPGVEVFRPLVSRASQEKKG